MSENNFSSAGAYLKNLREKGKKSRVYNHYQAIGLALSDILEDRSHKILYISLAKKYDAGRLLEIAKDIADRAGVRNRGAYFMKVLKEQKIAGLKPIKLEKKKKQLKLKIRKRKK